MTVAAKREHFTSPDWSYQRKLHELVSKYEDQGYEVEIAPPQYRLPKFLRGFFPDFVATRAQERIVVEIRSAVKVRPVNYWRNLAAVVQEHKSEGWRLKTDIDNQPVDDAVNKTFDDIEHQLCQSEEFQNNGQLTHAFVTAWPAVVEAMRWAADANQVEMSDYTAARLISSLYADGVLERSDYDLLVKYLRFDLANPESRAQVDANDLLNLRALARQLLLPQQDTSVF